MARLLIFLSLVVGCGATGGSGGGASHLPVSGAGPFSALEMKDGDLIEAPTVLSDSAVDLDDPDVFADGAALTVWVTAHRAAGDDIERADAPSVRKGFGELEPALAADQPWEGGGVSAPSVVPGSPMLLFYFAAGGIGYATSSDGHSWTKAAGPVIAGAGPPAAVRIGDRVRVYYPKNGSIFAAESKDLSSWTELGELVHSVPFGVALGRAFARAANTPAGRLRHDLYFTVETGNPTLPTTCGFAASFDGAHFEVETTPITDPKHVTRAPTMAPYHADGVDGALLLWTERRGPRDSILAGKSP